SATATTAGLRPTGPGPTAAVWSGSLRAATTALRTAAVRAAATLWAATVRSGSLRAATAAVRAAAVRVPTTTGPADARPVHASRTPAATLRSTAGQCTQAVENRPVDRYHRGGRRACRGSDPAVLETGLSDHEGIRQRTDGVRRRDHAHRRVQHRRR